MYLSLQHYLLLLLPLLPTRHNASFAFCFVHFGQQPPQRRPGRAQRLPCHHRGGVVHGLADFVHLALQIFHVRRRHGAASAFLALRWRWRRHIVLFDGHRHFFQRFQKVGDLNGVDVCRTINRKQGNKETRKQGRHVQLTIWPTKNNTTTTTQPTPTNQRLPSHCFCKSCTACELSVVQMAMVSSAVPPGGCHCFGWLFSCSMAVLYAASCVWSSSLRGGALDNAGKRKKNRGEEGEGG